MLTLRRSGERGTTQIDWLDSRHTFSFGDYYDSKWHNYRALRVINEDFIGADGGFPRHPHRDMEILTYVMQGQLQHRDSMGNGTVINAGEWQKMSAGTGIFHSEFNPSHTEQVHLYQIWVMPKQKGLTPEYDQKIFTPEAKRGGWLTIASQDGRNGSIRVHQDMTLFSTIIGADEERSYPLAEGRGAWLQVASGTVSIRGQSLKAGDAVAIENEAVLVRGIEEAEVLLFDLA